MEINQRITQLIKELGVTAQKFAESIGTNSSNITHITGNRSKPGYGVLSSILSTYREVSPYWLLLGEGEMFISSLEQPSTESSSPQDVAINIPFNDIIGVVDTPQESLGVVESTASGSSVDTLEDFGGLPLPVAQSQDDLQGGNTVAKRTVRKVMLLYSDGSFEEFSS